MAGDGGGGAEGAAGADELPTVVLAGARGSGQRRLLAALADRDEEELERGAADGVEAQLENRYYTARVRYRLVDIDRGSALLPGARDALLSADALVLLWDLADPDAFSSARTALEEAGFPLAGGDSPDSDEEERVLLCVAVESGAAAAAAGEEAEEVARGWCAEHGLEHLRCGLGVDDLEPLRRRRSRASSGAFGGLLGEDTDGTPLRILEALECHQWPNLQRRAGGGAPGGGVAFQPAGLPAGAVPHGAGQPCAAPAAGRGAEAAPPSGCRGPEEPQAGDRVEFHGLSGRADLNGRAGAVRKFVAEKQRFAVVPEGDQEAVLVQAKNIRKVGAACHRSEEVPLVAFAASAAALAHARAVVGALAGASPGEARAECSTGGQAVLETKYYRARLWLEAFEAPVEDVPAWAASAAGLVLLWDTGRPETFARVRRLFEAAWPAAGDLGGDGGAVPPPVRLCVAVCGAGAGEAGTEARTLLKEAEDWCVAQGVEHLPCSLGAEDLRALADRWRDGAAKGARLLAADEAGAVRIVEALESNPWPGLDPKQPPGWRAGSAEAAQAALVTPAPLPAPAHCSAAAPAAGDPRAAAAAGRREGRQGEEAVDAIERLSSEMRAVREITDEAQRKDRACEVAMRLAEALGCDSSDGSEDEP